MLVFVTNAACSYTENAIKRAGANQACEEKNQSYSKQNIGKSSGNGVCKIKYGDCDHYHDPDDPVGGAHIDFHKNYFG
jgi:hypothetical protein